MISKETMNENSKVKNVIAVMSGKGGVGKSSVTSLIASTLRNAGHSVGILDADVTGPSIPKVFGINKRRATGSENGVNPVVTSSGIKIMSVNLILEDETAPVVWRGPVISNSVKQFYSEVNWGELDYLLIDLPPGTGDVPLTIMQSFELSGVVVVTSPQDLVGLIVKKSVKMIGMLNVPVLGLVENMSYYECHDCKSRIHIFGESRLESVAEDMNLNVIAQIPIDPELARLCDEGKIELYSKLNYTFDEYFSNSILKMIGGLNE